MELLCFSLMQLLTIICITKYAEAQNYRMDYMWALPFKTFYRLHDLATMWHQARTICEAEGTSLLVPDNVEEMDNLKLLVSNMKPFYSAIFIGLHDQFATGHFVDLKGQPIKESILEYLWGEGLPDNHNFSENCVVMTREGLFDDRPCDDIYPFVCKILVSDIKHNDVCTNFHQGYKPFPAFNKCYHYHEEPLNWHEAYLVCKSEEGYLAIINSQEEAALITKFLGDHLHSDAPNPNILLLGFTDLLFPFQYRTIFGQSLEDAGYSSWSPTREATEKHETRHCGAISRTGFLVMVSCDQPAMFLCERDIQPASSSKSNSTQRETTTATTPTEANTNSAKRRLLELEGTEPDVVFDSSLVTKKRTKRKFLLEASTATIVKLGSELANVTNYDYPAF